MSEDDTKLWLMKQPVWQIYLPAPRHIPRPNLDVESPNAVSSPWETSGREESFLSMHRQLLILQADSMLPNLSPQRILLRSQELFRQLTSVDHWDGQKFFRLILGVNSWAISQERFKRWQCNLKRLPKRMSGQFEHTQWSLLFLDDSAETKFASWE